jgi:RNA polymerase sigma-70 factor (ECF subfamily)
VSGEQPKLAVVVPIRAAAALRPLDDVALVALVTERDPDAVRELYRRHAPAAERMLVRMLGFVPERADLLHDVFVRVLEHIGDLRSPASVRSWICGIAVRRAQEHRRARRHSPVGLANEPFAIGSDPEAALEVRRVYALLERLDEDDRTAFVLRRIEGMELSEVATTCGVSLATIKRRITRAEQRFEVLAAADTFLRYRLEGRRP